MLKKCNMVVVLWCSMFTYCFCDKYHVMRNFDFTLIWDWWEKLIFGIYQYLKSHVFLWLCFYVQWKQATCIKCCDDIFNSAERSILKIHVLCIQTFQQCSTVYCNRFLYNDIYICYWIFFCSCTTFVYIYWLVFWVTTEGVISAGITCGEEFMIKHP